MKKLVQIIPFFFFIIFIILLYPSDILAQTNDFPYDLFHSDREIELHHKLDEISGIAVSEKYIYAVQDGKANIYQLEMNGTIKNTFDFGKDGDYEDIAKVGKRFYALRSDGRIMVIDRLKKKTPKIEKIKTPLNALNDAEGLCYDPLSNELLIACKASASLKPGQYNSAHKAVYSYNLEQQKFIKKPFILLHLDSVTNQNKGDYFERISTKIASFLHESGDIRFQPSAIGVHPLSNNIYMLSANSFALLVLHRNGDVLHYIPLNKKLFKQAEGLCFDEEGSLYISNEADGGRANILVFKFQPYER